MDIYSCSIYIYVCINMCIYSCSIYIYIYMYVCINICIYSCNIYICIYIAIVYIYIVIHRQTFVVSQLLSAA